MIFTRTQKDYLLLYCVDFDGDVLYSLLGKHHCLTSVLKSQD